MPFCGQTETQMNSYKRWNNIVGWIVFAIAAMTYLLTMEPSSSLWDCSEFIATSYKLEVGHPPGAPLFMLLARLATILAPSTYYVPHMVNAMNCLASAFCILFLFWTITHLARRILTRQRGAYESQHRGRIGYRCGRSTRLYLHRHLLVLGRRRRSICPLVDVHRPGGVAHAQMGGTGRPAPLDALDRADRLPDGAFDRRAHPQPADRSRAGIHLLFPQNAAHHVQRYCGQHPHFGRDSGFHQQYHHPPYGLYRRLVRPLLRQFTGIARQFRPRVLRSSPVGSARHGRIFHP